MGNKNLSIKEIQNSSLEILKDIDAFCRDYGIQYFVFFGTLIGAVRHKGFIPWDDDIDIVMPRAEYDRFIDEYSKAGKYRIVNHNTEPQCPYMITRISNDKYKMISNYGPIYKIGTFVDIYPFDGVGNNEEDIRRASILSRKYSRGLGRSLERNVIGSIKDTHNGIKKWRLLIPYYYAKRYKPEIYRERLLDLRKACPEYECSEYVGCLIWSLIKQECFKREWLNDVVDMQFEDMTVMAPACYDQILKHNFGDYMKLPPEEQRIAHHYYSICVAD